MNNILKIIYSVLIAFIFTLTYSCSDHTLSNQTSEFEIEVTFEKSALVQQIVGIVLIVQAYGNGVVDSAISYADTTDFNSDATFTFETFKITTGSYQFTIYAIDIDKGILYQGTSIESISSEQLNMVSFELEPAVPMVKISPYYNNVDVESAFDVDISLWNISNFYNASFKIVFDTTLVAYGDQVTYSNDSWQDLIAFARQNADTLLITASRTDEQQQIEANDMINISFISLQPGTTTLHLIVDMIEDFNGTIIEFNLLHVDDQILVIE